MSEPAVESATKRVARALNLVEASYEDLKFLYARNPDWDEGLLYQIQEATSLLGYTLATLTNWDDEEEATNGEG